MSPKEYLTPEDASLIENAAQCLRDKLLIRLLRRLGCRVTEVLHLEERHIDFAHRQVRIEHQKVHRNLYCPHCKAQGESTHLSMKAVFCPRCGRVVKEAIAKENTELELRKIPVDRATLDLIREYIKRGGVQEVDDKRMLFTISRATAWRIVVECSERAGFFELENPKNEKLHHVSPHKFRDAFAIAAVKKRPSINDARLLQEILGHKKIDTTMEYRKVAGVELQAYYDDVVKEG